jgi:hypothetical protein
VTMCKTMMLHVDQRIRGPTFWEQCVAPMLIKCVVSETRGLKKTVRGSKSIESRLPNTRKLSGEAPCMSESHSCSLHLNVTFLDNAAGPSNMTCIHYEKEDGRTDSEIRM